MEASAAVPIGNAGGLGQAVARDGEVSACKRNWSRANRTCCWGWEVGMRERGPILGLAASLPIPQLQECDYQTV